MGRFLTKKFWGNDYGFYCIYFKIIRKNIIILYKKIVYIKN